MNNIVLKCIDERRRQLVRDQANKYDGLNGIDYVEVIEGSKQLELCVHFFGDVPDKLVPANVQIECGERIRNIKVLKVEPHRSADPMHEDCLRVTVDKAGDFSCYKLCLYELEADGDTSDRLLEGFDPRYACATFNFKVDCPSELDCKDENACPPDTQDEPEINYLSKDYASFRQLILDRLSLLMPDWRERHIPDIGIALVEVLAYTGDYLSYYQDAVATEAYLDTARQRISVRRHARLVDYFMHEGCNARAWICVEVDNEKETLSANDFYFITGCAELDNIGSNVISEDSLKKLNIPSGSYDVFEPLVEDKSKEFEFYESHNEISFYTWGDAECCLLRGATRATLLDRWVEVSLPPPTQQTTLEKGKTPKEEPQKRERSLHLQVGDVLIFEEVFGSKTGDKADADPTRRCAVRLTQVEPREDPLTKDPIVEIEWAQADALPFALCLSARLHAALDCRVIENVSVARGNVILVDYGKTIFFEKIDGIVPTAETIGECSCEDSAVEFTDVPGKFQFTLKNSPLTFSQTLSRKSPASTRLIQDSREALPNVTLYRKLPKIDGEFADQGESLDQSKAEWHPKFDLLNSDSDEQSFVVEIDNDGRARIRFGDGECGRMPIKGNGNSLPELGRILKELNDLVDLREIPTTVKTEQTNLNRLFKSLLISPSLQPADSLQLVRSLEKAFNPESDIRTKLLANFHPQLKENLYSALSKATVNVVQPELQGVYALRVTAPLFGYNAPMITFKIKDGRLMPLPPQEHENPEVKSNERANQLFLDNAYDQISASNENKLSYIVINRTEDSIVQTFQIKKAEIRPRDAYGLSGKTTSVILDGAWRVKPKDGNQPEKVAAFGVIRETIVYTQSELLTLADKPIADDISGDKIELGALYEGLEAGRWIIVSGERADISGVSGVMVSELAMLAGVEQSFKPGDKYHTTLLLAGQNINGKPGLQYKYKRNTVRIYGNVVKATHGETRSEVLGSGDATKAMQSFALKQPPLTFVSAATPSGIESTLHVRVNDVEWHETDSLAELKPQDRKFITKTDDEAKTIVIFGNGEQGARLPTGIENVKAVYRNGIGKVGNVKAEQISLLMTKPLGVKEVINPLRASGGADKETRDQARRNVPIALMALDRLVSTKDYADFARTFAGIGKSSASRQSDGRRQVVHLTIAGAEDIPIDVNSDLYHNLRRALSKYGDAYQPVQVVKRELLALIIVAKVSILADYLWESVEPKIRVALLEAFSFERRELGQSVFLSEIIGVMQRVEGVAYVDVDVLDGISETELENEKALSSKLKTLLKGGKPNQYVHAKLARVETGSATKEKKILPAQLAYLTPDVKDTLILNKIEEVKK